MENETKPEKIAKIEEIVGRYFTRSKIERHAEKQAEQSGDKNARVVFYQFILTHDGKEHTYFVPQTEVEALVLYITRNKDIKYLTKTATNINLA